MTIMTGEEDMNPMDTPGRLGKLRDALPAAGCDALIVTSLTNVRYLTGFTGSAGLLLVLPGDTVLVTDGRYGGQSVEQLKAAGVEARVEVAPAAAQRRAVTGLVDQAPIRRLGLEAAHISWARQQVWAGE